MILILHTSAFSIALSLFIHDFNDCNIFHPVGLDASYLAFFLELCSWAVFPGGGLQGEITEQCSEDPVFALALVLGPRYRPGWPYLPRNPHYLFLLQAANNLIVLGREEAGAEKIFQNNGVALLLQLLDTKKPELVLAAVRTLSGMCSSHRARVSPWL